jgi:predicted DNA-binding protein
MKSGKKDKKDNSGSIKIFPEVHQRLVEYCKKEGIKISYFASNIIKEKLQQTNNQ